MKITSFGSRLFVGVFDWKMFLSVLSQRKKTCPAEKFNFLSKD